MIENKTYIFNPDYAVHPGEIIFETIEVRNMKQIELADRCGLNPKTINQIIHGKAPVTPETAIQLERVLGVSAAVWNNLDANYRIFVAKQLDSRRLAEQKTWASKFPIKELVKRGVIPKGNNAVDIVSGLLDFFGVGSIQAWEDRFKKMIVAFRHSPSFNSSFEDVAVWLRLGELRADNIECNKYNEKEFKLALQEIRGLTCKNPNLFEPELKKLCLRAGVALVFVAELPGTHLSGATCWLNSDKAMIILSMRHKRDDHFWFSFFHEAGHILLHGKKSVFIDDHKYNSDEENEADEFAGNILIPKKEYQNFLHNTSRITKSAIREFASGIGIASGIVVGRLQHDGKIKHEWHVDLTRKYVFIE